jgi:hypothetical protein
MRRYHLRPPRFLNVSGMCTVIVAPSAETAARFTLPPSCCPPIPDQPGEPIRPEPELDAVHPHIDPLDQQLDDPRLLGGEQLVRQRIELGKRRPDFVLGKVVLLAPRRAPNAHDSPSSRPACIWVFYRVSTSLRGPRGRSMPGLLSLTRSSFIGCDTDHPGPMIRLDEVRAGRGNRGVGQLQPAVLT